jgi:SAM-dependent methyltransferase
MLPFQKYSVFYDLLYRDKDYVAEAEYVVRAIKEAVPQACTILELGSGTGRHGRLLAGMGFDVHGIERSPEMVSVAKQAAPSGRAATTGKFTCEVGDICAVALGRSFDAVISLFHVISYQTTNEALLAAFRVAAEHLRSGGVFMFDVWHGPAVLTERPGTRVKEVSDDRYAVKRTARPELDTNCSTVKVTYEMDCRDRQTEERFQFSEEHLMRYLFPTEIDLLAQSCGLRRAATEEFLSRRFPSPATWGVMYVLTK